VLQGTEILSDRLWKMLAYPRFRALLLVVFGAGALLLAAVGIYGVVTAIGVSAAAELGLRRAVGARGADLAWLVARQAGSATVIGLAVGVVTTLAAKVVQGMLYVRVKAGGSTDIQCCWSSFNRKRYPRHAPPCAKCRSCGPNNGPPSRVIHSLFPCAGSA
jgi:hypothetical protein